MTKKVNTKPFCKAWNEAIKPKETWSDIIDKCFEMERESFERYLMNNYEPPKHIKHEDNKS